MTDEGLRNPFVLQCAKCSKILTDSFSLHTVQDSYLVHSFSNVTEVGKECQGENTFKGCTIQPVSCGGCKTPVGVFLISVTGSWNGYAGMFCFEKEKVTSYMLGNTVYKEKSMMEIAEDVEKLKGVVAKIYKKIYQQ